MVRKIKGASEGSVASRRGTSVIIRYSDRIPRRATEREMSRTWNWECTGGRTGEKGGERRGVQARARGDRKGRWKEAGGGRWLGRTGDRTSSLVSRLSPSPAGASWRGAGRPPLPPPRVGDRCSLTDCEGRPATCRIGERRSAWVLFVPDPLERQRGPASAPSAPASGFPGTRERRL